MEMQSTLEFLLVKSKEKPEYKKRAKQFLEILFQKEEEKRLDDRTERHRTSSGLPIPEVEYTAFIYSEGQIRGDEQEDRCLYIKK
jgi:hypothetical protein